MADSSNNQVGDEPTPAAAQNETSREATESLPVAEPDTSPSNIALGSVTNPALPFQTSEAKMDQMPTQAESAPLVQRHFVAPALIPLDRISQDVRFQIRGAGGLEDVSDLAMDIARLGQLFPIDLRLIPAGSGDSGFQIISGFRRVAALRFLRREKVLARLHTDLSERDALLMALACAIHNKSVSRDELKTRFLGAESELPPAAQDMLRRALSDDLELSPEGMEEEVDADELASDVTTRLVQLNQDLSLLADVFSDLQGDRASELLNQLRYSAQLVTFLEGKL
jgi:ParB family transcriptional regulator, chromosome partitioning protein